VRTHTVHLGPGRTKSVFLSGLFLETGTNQTSQLEKEAIIQINQREVSIWSNSSRDSLFSSSLWQKNKYIQPPTEMYYSQMERHLGEVLKLFF